MVWGAITSGREGRGRGRGLDKEKDREGGKKRGVGGGSLKG